MPCCISLITLGNRNPGAESNIRRRDLGQHNRRRTDATLQQLRQSQGGEDHTGQGRRIEGVRFHHFRERGRRQTPATRGGGHRSKREEVEYRASHQEAGKFKFSRSLFES